MTVEVIQKNLEGWWKIRYEGKEGWAPASYLKKADVLCPKMAAGASIHASTNDLESACKQQNVGARQRPPPRRDLTIPRGANLPKPPVPPQVEEEYYTIADFQTTIPDGISFQAGVKVEVVEKNSSGWWYIQIDDKEGWAPVTFIDKYKKTSSASRPNFLAPLPGEMAQLNLEDGMASENTWSKPLPEEPPTNSDFSNRAKLREWKPNSVKGSSHFSGALPPPEEKPALPPRRESIHKSLELEDKPKPDLSKPLPPKPPIPGVIAPTVPPKAAPHKPDKPPEIKKDEKNKQLFLRNEMGLECGHNISAKEVKKFNLKHVAKQPPKPKPDAQEDKPDSPTSAPSLKPKPVIRPKPIPAAKPEPVAKNDLDITNLRSKLRPSKPPEFSGNSGEPVQANDTSNSHNITRTNEEPKFPPKQQNGHDPTETFKLPKEPPQRPSVAPRRPPPPKKSSEPSSLTESKPPLKDSQEAKPAPPPQIRPPPPKSKAFLVPSPKDKEESKPKVPIPPKPLIKADKPGPPRDKLPPLIKDPAKEELFLAVADFEGDEQTPGFKEGTVFEVIERNSSGWWFCKGVSDGPVMEGWIPSNYLSKKP
ncbi:hypothetical protein DNTS_031665 [Danionella cerebrum]|uniref:SH3 domain-containing protein n=1 Tax=Danionella cerebrum TaxID=2873325 RepID=A0A553PVN6_9TELE|nr:hypothetical protein DNTS_031665 [Danionella translucida]TRY81753.1 hypothetical protein DNTS_031665 [Danionella translucida]